MDTKHAFEAILEAIRRDAHKRLVEGRYFEEMFGNFIIDFEDGGQPASIVNDRFELVKCEDFGGEGKRETVLQSLREVDEDAALRALKL